MQFGYFSTHGWDLLMADPIGSEVLEDERCPAGEDTASAVSVDAVDDVNE